MVNEVAAPIIRSITWRPDGTIELRWQGANYGLGIETSDELSAGNWKEAAGAVVGTSWTLVPDSTSGVRSEFFRLVLQ